MNYFLLNLNFRPGTWKIKAWFRQYEMSNVSAEFEVKNYGKRLFNLHYKYVKSSLCVKRYNAVIKPGCSQVLRTRFTEFECLIAISDAQKENSGFVCLPLIFEKKSFIYIHTQ